MSENRPEDLIEKICKKMFLSDFTVRNPKYKKGGVLEKEIADFIVPYKDTLIAFQVKSKIEIKDAEQKTHVDYQRIQRKIDEGVSQFKAIKEAISGKLFSSLTTVRGVTIPFDFQKANKVIGIVIIDLIGEERFPKEKRTDIYGGLAEIDGIMVHIFMREDFEKLSTELDTMPDFLKYLNIRAELKMKGAVSFASNELDFLAIYKTKWPMIEGLLSGKIDCLHLTDGIWEEYQKCQEAIDKRSLLNHPSYLVDNIIESLHEAIGFEIKGLDIESIRSKHPQGTVSNYWASISELADIPRLERRKIGEKFLEKMKKASVTGSGYGFVEDPIIKRGVLLFSCSEERKIRADRLFSLCAAAYCARDLNKVIGIATEPFNFKAFSYDVLVFDSVKFENHEQLAEQGKRMFKAPQNFKHDEWE